jgi:prepilin-type N-terminal cleavage/methylation domain-containing protein
MRKLPGFTIVELLIVIVVIAILAAITIVAFNGVQDRAKNTAMTSGINQYAKALINYGTINGQYPTTALGCFDGTTTCWGSANQAASTALLAAVQSQMSGAPLSLPYTRLLQYSGYHYILFQVTGSACPAISGTTFMSPDSAGGNLINCRVRLPATG